MPVEGQETPQQHQLGLFNQPIPEELEARILSLLDLRSLIRCRLLSWQWKNSVDNLYCIWGAMARRMGFAEPEDHNSDGEAGERIGLQKLLKMVTGDWWFNCSLCPVADQADLEESDAPAVEDLKLAWVCLDKIPNGLLTVLLVTALDRRSALLHKWRLRLLDYPGVSWKQVAMFKETRIGWLAAVEPVKRALYRSQKTDTIDNRMETETVSHNFDVASDYSDEEEDIFGSYSSSDEDEFEEHMRGPSAFEAENQHEWLKPGNWIAIVPLEKCSTAPAVPICFLSLPSEDFAETIVGMEAFKCDKSGCELVHLLILTQKRLLLYSSKPAIIDESESPKSLQEPDSFIVVLNRVQTSDHYSTGQVAPRALFLYEVTQTAISNFVMPGEHYFAVIVCEWQRPDSSYTKVVLARSKCQSLMQMTSIQLDAHQGGHFLLRTEELHNFDLCLRELSCTSEQSRQQFRLAKVVLKAPDNMELEVDECCYEYEAFEFLDYDKRIECFERGKKFWYIIIGPTILKNSTPVAIIYRVGNFSPILKLDLRKTIPQRAIVNTRQMSCNTYSFEWLDRGLTLTEGSKLQPLMIMGWSYGFELLIGWSTVAQRMSSLCSKTKIFLDLPEIWGGPV